MVDISNFLKPASLALALSTALIFATPAHATDVAERCNWRGCQYIHCNYTGDRCYRVDRFYDGYRYSRRHYDDRYDRHGYGRFDDYRRDDRQRARYRDRYDDYDGRDKYDGYDKHWRDRAYRRRDRDRNDRYDNDERREVYERYERYDRSDDDRYDD